ncbi:kelch-like protein 17 [Gigaspora margarita]|uniref:Kelch-like protein 17 n=1 Tax=Gigaspora margarita TaxID=4874 RepID=A0A8H4B5L4_GIGMA|nr:kelch-like protein 17 [Gigaspora margarita]
MKVKGTDEILGGYNPVGWDYPDNPDDPNTRGSIKTIFRQLRASFGFNKNCNDSFTFSLRNGTIQNSILSRVKEPELAIYCESYCGPIFGSGPYYLVMINNFNQDKGCFCRKSPAYENSIRNESTYDEYGMSHFSVEEYEIFQINKKP